MVNRKNKKAALELSIGTIVILVIGMSMLILGLVLVRTIFKSATGSVNILDDRVKGEITNLFADENQKIIVKLGGDLTAKIAADTKNFGIAFGARTLDGNTVDTTTFRYKLTLDDKAQENCVKAMGETAVSRLISQELDTFQTFDTAEGDTAFALVQISIPDGTELCSQKVFVDVKDGDKTVGRGMFIFQVVRKGLF
jgi:hypothetical protein